MRKRIVSAILLVTSQGLCQTPATESDTLHALLVEVRQLRQAIEGMTAASQRVQIALSAIQSQDAALARSTQRMEAVRNNCTGKEERRQQIAANIQRMEGALASGKLPATETKMFEEQVVNLKKDLELQQTEVQTCRVGEADAVSQFRTDQAMLAELRDRMDRLDKALERPVGPGRL